MRNTSRSRTTWLGTAHTATTKLGRRTRSLYYVRRRRHVSFTYPWLASHVDATLYMSVYIYIYIEIYKHISSVYFLFAYGYVGRAMVERRRRRRLHRRERSLGTACDVPAWSSISITACPLPVGVYMYTNIQIYTHAYTCLHMHLYVHADFFLTRLMHLSLVCSWVVSLRRSRWPFRLRYLERRHVRHRDLQGELMPIFFTFVLCTSI